MNDFLFVRVDRKPQKTNECIVFRMLEDSNLSRYILFDNTYDEDGNVSNINRHNFIFPNLNVNKGDFIRIYTKKGERNAFSNKSHTTTYELYWGFDEEYTIWNNPSDVAVIIKIESGQSFRV